MSERLEINVLSKFFCHSDYVKGLAYYQQKRVKEYSEERTQHRQIEFFCSVKGTKEYIVKGIYSLIKPLQFAGFCNCPQFAATDSCKHMVAAFAYSFNYDLESEYDYKGRLATQHIINYYKKSNSDISTMVDGQKARLVPFIKMNKYGFFPDITLKIGYKKLYVVKSISELLDNFDRELQYDYGKNLSICHKIDNFDENSQKLIALLMDQRTQKLENINSFVYDYYKVGNEICIKGKAFADLLDIYKDDVIIGKDGKEFSFCNENPKLSVKFEKSKYKNNIYNVSICPNDDLNYFGNINDLYICLNNFIYKCDKHFSKKVFPFLKEGTKNLKILKEEMTDFCSCVLPEIKPYIDVMGETEEIFEEFLPDECIPCYYFDMNDDKINAKLSFKYGEEVLDEETFTEINSNIKRDVKTENVAKNLLEQVFKSDENKSNYYIDNDDEIYNFITEKISNFYELGEVYVTDKLRNKKINSNHASVNISVSDGLLEMNFDTGEFPTNELESLYQSLLLKKKYYRLKDGRFLTLDGSAYETLAEISHMTQLSKDELESGVATMPSYRSLYLDNALKSNDNIDVNRDNHFKSMVRSFKTVSDSDYEVPEQMKGILRPYQKTGYRWLKTLENSHFGGILADEMGLGKTLQIITYLSSIYPQKEKPSLIVSPASLVLNWADEFEKFNSDLSVLKVIGNTKERENILNSDLNNKIIITSYDLLKRDIEKYKNISFYCCTIDEGQYIKNQSTLASKALKSINCEQRFVLTGTPIENRLSELWNLFDFIMPEYLFSHNKFVEKLEKPIVKSGDEQAHKQLNKMIMPFILRRLKKDVLKELPPKEEHIYNVSLSEGERKVYAAYVNAIKENLDGSKFEILAALTRLRQICCDPNLCYENYQGETSKLDACMYLCKEFAENGHQILVFSQFTSMLDNIKEKLDKENISNFTIQGSTSKQKRQELVKRFNDGQASVFLISLKAGGTGLNLTSADVVIHYDPWWNIAAQNQATDRAHRIGQKSSVNIYKLIAKDTIEEKILKLQERKSQLMEVITENSDVNIMNMSAEELLELIES